jgi:hypothetical protein
LTLSVLQKEGLTSVHAFNLEKKPSITKPSPGVELATNKEAILQAVSPRSGAVAKAIPWILEPTTNKKDYPDPEPELLAEPGFRLLRGRALVPAVRTPTTPTASAGRVISRLDKSSEAKLLTLEWPSSGQTRRQGAPGRDVRLVARQRSRTTFRAARVARRSRAAPNARW